MRTHYKVIAILLLLACLPGLQLAINAMREPLVPTRNVYLSVTPGEFVGTLLLGGFRGIAIDVLWLRAQKLQQDEKFFELIAISDLIAKLQPHDRMVWEFNAWNRAYNVSVKFHDRADRWKWVKSGLDLNLEGIRRLPMNWKLRKHMAFMLMHKCEDYQEETLREFGENNFALARKYYQDALRLNPDAPLHVDRAVIHTYEKEGDYETALKKYNEHLKRFPNDRIARQNRDEYMLEKERFKYYTDEAVRAYEAGEWDQTIEVYEDHIVGRNYLMPMPAIMAIAFAYRDAAHYDEGATFLAKVLSRRMPDPEAVRNDIWEPFSRRYNDHYIPRLTELKETGDLEALTQLYREKFIKKSVDISLDGGIIVLDAMTALEHYDDARDLLLELTGHFPHAKELQAYRGLLRRKSDK